MSLVGAEFLRVLLGRGKFPRHKKDARRTEIAQGGEEKGRGCYLLQAILHKFKVVKSTYAGTITDEPTELEGFFKEKC